MGESVPEGRCLTVVFKGPRKSLDLLCQSPEEAQNWARGIRTLQGRVENMTQKEKLDQYPVRVQAVETEQKDQCVVISLTVRWRHLDPCLPEPGRPEPRRQDELRGGADPAADDQH